MIIQLGREYRTMTGHKAIVLYKQPEDVVDEFPYVGYMELLDSKYGLSWNMDGLSNEDISFDLVDEWK